ncbi:hypothetical protein ALP40_04834 [Pseudomonas viridiflava]|nr:hypothetical protein ALP40_04834 [Pseudomonas viridiflava]
MKLQVNCPCRNLLASTPRTARTPSWDSVQKKAEWAMVIANGKSLGHIIVPSHESEYGHVKTAATIARFAQSLHGCILAAYFEERSMVEDVELNRLYWHSRRGMLELDVLLVPFVREVYPHLNDVDRDLYRRLLTCEDQDMFGWFMQRAESEDPELQRMVRMILDRVQPK